MCNHYRIRACELPQRKITKKIGTHMRYFTSSTLFAKYEIALYNPLGVGPACVIFFIAFTLAGHEGK